MTDRVPSRRLDRKTGSALFEGLENRRLLAATLLNGGFEAGSGTTADSWLQFVDGGALPTTVVQRVSTAPNTGSFNMVLTIDSSADSGGPGIARLEQFNPTDLVTPGEDYTFSVFARKNGAFGEGVVSDIWMQFLDADGSAGGGVKGEAILDITGLLNDSYQKFSVQMVAPAGADSIQVRVRLAGGAFDASDGSIFVDDASLTTGGGGGNNGSIAGNIFNDPNSNGIKDGPDTNIAGWQVYLDTNNNNVRDTGEATATTDGNGNYTFTSLADGTYHVKQVLQSGYRKTNPGTGIPGYDVAISGGNAVTARDFGNTTNIRLAGVVYNDANSNGVQDGGEAGIPGVVVDIISNSTIVATRTTDATGAWRVQGLSAGTGEAKVTLPSGFVATAPIGGVYAGSMSSGQQNANLNFGIRQAAPAPAPFSAASILESSIDSVIDDLV